MPNETVSDQINVAQSQQAPLVARPNLRENNKRPKNVLIRCFSLSRAAFVKLTSHKLEFRVAPSRF